MARPAEQPAPPLPAARRGRRLPEHGLPTMVAKVPGSEDRGEVEGRERSDCAVGQSLKCGGGGQW
jgi:hypothetical protein